MTYHYTNDPYNEMEWEDNDHDPNNPVDMSADAWANLYGKLDDFEGYLDHDHSMDY